MIKTLEPALLAPALFASLALAQDVVLGPHGGASGTPFSTSAPAGERLRRIEVRSGTFLDAVRLVYENRFDVQTTATPWYGATSGSTASFAIPDGDYLARVEVWSAIGYVNRVRFTTNRGVQASFGAPYVGETHQSFAMNQREVVGIVGRSAALVTALGIVVRPVLATEEVFGSGCPGSTGTPTIVHRAGTTPFRIGGWVIIDSGSLRPGSAAVLFYGASTTNWLGVPLPAPLDAFGAPGCRLLVSIDFSILTLAEPNGVAGHTLNLPNTPSLIGGNIAFQWMVRDLAANALGFAFSPALKAMIGSL